MAIDSNSDKEKLVMKLLEEGKNFQEIAKEAHVSFCLISMVNKKRLVKTPQPRNKYRCPRRP
jgi:uncharacterized protein YerC